MSNRYAGHIVIGGELPRSKVPDLVELICRDGLQAEHLEEFDPRGETDLLAAVDRDGHLALWDPEAPYGVLVDLETELQGWGLHYCRWDVGDGSMDPEKVYCAPNDGTDGYNLRILSFRGDGSGGIALVDDELDCVRRALCIMRFTGRKSPRSVGWQKRVQELLEAALPDEPKIPVFKVVEG